MMPSFFGFRKPKGLSIKSAIFFSMKKKKKKERPSTTSMISHRTTGTTTSVAASASKNDISPFARAYDHDLATKFSDNVVNDLELLLSMETQARMDALEARQQQEEEEAAQAAATAVRSRRLTFELPTKPITPSPSPLNNNNNNNNRRGSLGSIYSTTSNEDGGGSSSGCSSMSVCSGPEVGDNAVNIIPIHMNARVRLIRRPLPTYGYVRFIGHVDFAPGEEWVGIELDSRVGKNDGSVKGKRYFSTDRDRGIFALKENLEVIV
ncbi:hypothetical protein BDC45DRAFT_508181 [Circinella umbellata]|nr:hypothetical protein BDC45DRAFT_508181 [Circinella umbellata]